MKTRVDYNWLMHRVDVWVFERAGIDADGSVRAVGRIDPETGRVELTEVVSVFEKMPAPTFAIPLELVPDLLEQLQAISPVRPEPKVGEDAVRAADAEGRLTATERHLDDMRRIVLQQTPLLLDGSISVFGRVNPAERVLAPEELA